MSLQEIKAHIIETVTNSENEKALIMVSEYIDQALSDNTGFQMTEADWAAVQRGREQYERGEYSTLDDLDRAMKAGIEEGLRQYKQDQRVQQ